MRSHLCNDDNIIKDGTVRDCGCAEGRGTSAEMLNRSGYQTKVRIRQADGPPEKAIVRHRDHYDGSIDGKVRPKPLTFKMSKSEMGI